MSKAPAVSPLARRIAREALWTLKPSRWSRDVVGLELDPFQARLVDAYGGTRAIALCHRQSGKTTAASIGLAHTLLRRRPGSTSLVLAPTARQSAELIRRLRGVLLKAGADLDADNAFSVALPDGSRCLGLPGSDDSSIRGLSVNGDLVIDEAARVSDQLYDAARPMLIRHANDARLMLLSTPWAKAGFFYRIWNDGDERDWLKVQARVEECRHLSPAIIEAERRAMPASTFAREYLLQFDAIEQRYFDADAIAGAFGEPTAAPPHFDEEAIIHRAPAFSRAVSGAFG
jgi:hypothetical protein